MLLLLRKHVAGSRITGLWRPAGERWLVLEAGEVRLILRPGGPSPALTLVVGETAVGSLGDGPAAWPLPAPDPTREWDRVDLGPALAQGAETGRVGVLLSACPGLGTELARALLRRPDSWPHLRERLAAPRPTLRAPGAPAGWHDADLADPHAVAVLPLALDEDDDDEGPWLHPQTWTEAARLFWTARRRGQAFAARLRAQADERRREARRLRQLEAHLAHDLAGLPDPEHLRHQAEALLAYGGVLPPEAVEAEIPDPREPGRVLRVHVEPGRAAAAQADKLYARARRVERARVQVGARLAETRDQAAAAEASLAELSTARDLADLGPAPAARAARAERGESGPRHFLTSRGLSVFVGRGAKENHELTFGRAGPDDYWLHARDVPGAHVILRDRDGRANADDLREAAEIAAFFSGSRAEAQADVHLARRKHVRPAGGAGRVQVTHGETLRVKPRDPEGRLRRR
jgi:hypothetical protein